MPFLAPVIGALGGVGGLSGMLGGLGGLFGGLFGGGSSGGSSSGNTGTSGWAQVLSSLIGAGTNIYGGVAGSNASKDAAKIQADATKYAAQLQAQGLDKNLALQVAMFQMEQANNAPWLSTGAGALSKLGGMLGITPQPTTTLRLLPPPTPTQTTTSTGTTSSAPQSITFEQFKQQQGNSILSTVLSMFPVVGSSIGGGFGGMGGFLGGGVAGSLIGAIQGLLSGNAQPEHVQITDQFLHDLYDAGVQEADANGSTFHGVEIVPGSTANVEQGADFGKLLQGFDQKFTFDPKEIANDPGYKFRLAEGLKSVQNSGAAKGGGLSGAAMKALNNYASGIASDEVGNAYNRAASDYDRAFNTFNANQGNIFNRLAAMSGVGQTAVNQINSSAQQFGVNAGQALGAYANNVGDLAAQAANATASGYVGSANAWNNAIGNTGNIFQQLMAMYRPSSSSGSIGSQIAALPVAPRGAFNPALYPGYPI